MKRIISLSLLALALVGCSASTEVNRPVSTGPTTTPSTAPVAHVGATLSITGSANAQSAANLTAAVTLVQVIDPAQPTSTFVTPDAGKRFVATSITIKNTSAKAIQGDANNDSSLIGSDNQTYQPDFNTVNGCTDFNSGSYQLGPTESATGCVVYQVPTGVAPAKYQFSLNGGFGGDFAEWLIP